MTNISAETIDPAETKLPGEVKVCVTKLDLLTLFDIVPPLTLKGTFCCISFHSSLEYISNLLSVEL